MAEKKTKDTDYLYLSAYIHAKENNIIGRERLERMLEARSPAEALKVLEDAGWKIPGNCGIKELDRLLAQRRDDVFKDMGSLAPDVALVDIFRIKYDYHNAKVLIKASAMQTDAAGLLSGAGRILPGVLKECFLEGRLGSLPHALTIAIEEAVDILARTGDPQLVDFALDKAYYAEFIAESVKAHSDFLAGYAALAVDCANLKNIVRAVRMQKDRDFIMRSLIEGGSVKTAYITAALADVETVPELFGNTPLAAAVEEARNAMKGGKITGLEKRCDEALNAYAAKEKFTAFGENVLVGYLCAVEAEINSVRVVMTGQYAGIPAEVTRQRLREMS